MDLKKYKVSAVIGIVMIGIASFVACLAENPLLVYIGNGALLAGLAASAFGFSKWQP